MDLDSLISSFSTGTYSVTRRARPAIPYTRGIANDSTNTKLTITASVQPATGKDLLRLPEGRRTNETRALFTTTQLYTGDQGTAYEADLVSIDGEDWEVQSVAAWVQSGGGVAYKCIAQAPTPESSP